MDRDKRWLNAFWKQLSKDLRMKLNYSTAYHPQSDGQTERVNEIIEAYLRAFINYMQDDWDEWLDLAEMAWGIPSTPQQEYHHSSQSMVMIQIPNWL